PAPARLPARSSAYILSPAQATQITPSSPKDSTIAFGGPPSRSGVIEPRFSFPQPARPTATSRPSPPHTTRRNIPKHLPEGQFRTHLAIARCIRQAIFSFLYYKTHPLLASLSPHKKRTFTTVPKSAGKILSLCPGCFLGRRVLE